MPRLDSEREQLFVVNALSRPDAVAFQRAVYFERVYPGRLDDRETLAALRGYTCQASKRVRSAHAHYQVVVARIHRNGRQDRGKPFLPCQVDVVDP